MDKIETNGTLKGKPTHKLVIINSGEYISKTQGVVNRKKGFKSGVKLALDLDY